MCGPGTRTPATRAPRSCCCVPATRTTCYSTGRRKTSTSCAVTALTRSPGHALDLLGDALPLAVLRMTQAHGVRPAVCRWRVFLRTWSAAFKQHPGGVWWRQAIRVCACLQQGEIAVRQPCVRSHCGAWRLLKLHVPVARAVRQVPQVHATCAPRAQLHAVQEVAPGRLHTST